MLSLFKLKPGHLTYYLRKIAQYYLGRHSGGITFASMDRFRNHKGPPPKFVGKGAEELGLIGEEVTEKKFVSLFQGYDWRRDNSEATTTDTGGQSAGASAAAQTQSVEESGATAAEKRKKLVQNAGQQSRVPGFDQSFSADKSISVAMLFEPRIRDLFQRAIEVTLEVIEDLFCYCRVGKAGVDRQKVKAKAVWATFMDFDNREGEPNLHIHATLMNLGVCEDGKTRALVGKHLYKSQLFCGAFSRAMVAHLMTNELGARFEREGDTMRLVGVPDEVREATSTRRKQIVSRMREVGASTAHSAEIACLETRKPKAEEGHEEMLARMKGEVEQLGFSEKDAAKCFGHEGPKFPGWERVIDDALALLLKEKRHFTALDLATEALKELPKYGASPIGIDQHVVKYCNSNPDVVALRSEGGEQKFATAATLRAEKALFARVDRLVAQPQRTPATSLVEKVARKKQLSKKQMAALRQMAHSGRSIDFLIGRAGTGKTSRVIAAHADLMRRMGFKTVGVATSAVAANVLGTDADMESFTATKFLGDYEIPVGRRIAHELKLVKNAVRGYSGKRIEPPRAFKLTGKHIVYIDESSMVDPRHFEMILDAVDRAGARAVFIGDDLQCQAIEGQSPFGSLAMRYDASVLEEVLRQEKAWMREAVDHLLNGAGADALELYRRHGCLLIDKSVEDAMRRLADDWQADPAPPVRKVAIANTNDEAHELNQAIQQRRIDAGELGGEVNVIQRVLDSGDGRRHCYESRVHKGDRIRFRMNFEYGPECKFFNGSTGTVLGVGCGEKRTIRVRLDHPPQDFPEEIDVPLNKVNKIELAYAGTTHCVQGATFDSARFLAVGENEDLHSAYVQASRSSQRTALYTTAALAGKDPGQLSKSSLAFQLSKVQDYRLAHDLLPGDRTGDAVRKQKLESLLDAISEQSEATLEATLVMAADEEHAAEVNRGVAGLRQGLEARQRREAILRGEAPVRKASVVVGDRVFAVGEPVRMRLPHKVEDHQGRFRNERHGVIVDIDPKTEKIAIQPEVGVEFHVEKRAHFLLDHAYALTPKEAEATRRKVTHRYRVAKGEPQRDTWKPDKPPKTVNHPVYQPNEEQPKEVLPEKHVYPKHEAPAPEAPPTPKPVRHPVKAHCGMPITEFLAKFFAPPEDFGAPEASGFKGLFKAAMGHTMTEQEAAKLYKLTQLEVNQWVEWAVRQANQKQPDPAKRFATHTTIGMNNGALYTLFTRPGGGYDFTREEDSVVLQTFPAWQRYICWTKTLGSLFERGVDEWRKQRPIDPGDFAATSFVRTPIVQIISDALWNPMEELLRKRTARDVELCVVMRTRCEPKTQAVTRVECRLDAVRKGQQYPLLAAIADISYDKDGPNVAIELGDHEEAETLLQPLSAAEKAETGHAH